MKKTLPGIIAPLFPLLMVNALISGRERINGTSKPGVDSMFPRIPQQVIFDYYLDSTKTDSEWPAKYDTASMRNGLHDGDMISVNPGDILNMRF